MSRPGLAASVARSLRFLRNVRGWQRLAVRMAGANGRFLVENDGILFGAYEAD